VGFESGKSGEVQRSNGVLRRVKRPIECGPSGIGCVLSPLLSVASGTSKIYRSLLLAVSSSTLNEPSEYMILKIPPFAITASLLNTLKALSLQLVTNGLKAPSFRVSQKCLAVRPKSGLAASESEMLTPECAYSWRESRISKMRCQSPEPKSIAVFPACLNAVFTSSLNLLISGIAKASQQPISKAVHAEITAFRTHMLLR
jgi:hypothetical protein